MRRHVFGLSSSLARRGHEVTVITSDITTSYPFRRLESIPAQEEIDDFLVKRFRSYCVTEKVKTAKIIPGMTFEALKNRDADLIHAHAYGYYSWYGATIPGLLRKIPVIVTNHRSDWSNFDCNLNPALYNLFNTTLGRYVLKRANHVIAMYEEEKSARVRCWSERSNRRVTPRATRGRSIFWKEFMV